MTQHVIILHNFSVKHFEKRYFGQYPRYSDISSLGFQGYVSKQNYLLNSTPQGTPQCVTGES